MWWEFQLKGTIDFNKRLSEKKKRRPNRPEIKIVGIPEKKSEEKLAEAVMTKETVVGRKPGLLREVWNKFTR